MRYVTWRSFKRSCIPLVDENKKKKNHDSQRVLCWKMSKKTDMQGLEQWKTFVMFTSHELLDAWSYTHVRRHDEKSAMSFKPKAAACMKEIIVSCSRDSSTTFLNQWRNRRTNESRDPSPWHHDTRSPVHIAMPRAIQWLQCPSVDPLDWSLTFVRRRACPKPNSGAVQRCETQTHIYPKGRRGVGRVLFCQEYTSRENLCVWALHKTYISHAVLDSHN